MEFEKVNSLIEECQIQICGLNLDSLLLIGIQNRRKMNPENGTKRLDIINCLSKGCTIDSLEM